MYMFRIKGKSAHKLLNTSSKVKSCANSCYYRRVVILNIERVREKARDQVYTFKVNPSTGA